MRGIQLDESLSDIGGYIDVQVLELIAIFALSPNVQIYMKYGKFKIYTPFAIATPDYEPLDIWNLEDRDITVLINNNFVK